MGRTATSSAFASGRPIGIELSPDVLADAEAAAGDIPSNSIILQPASYDPTILPEVPLRDISAATVDIEAHVLPNSTTTHIIEIDGQAPIAETIEVILGHLDGLYPGIAQLEEVAPTDTSLVGAGSY